MKTPGLSLVAMGLALLAPVAFGATRTSANYSLTTETGDAGGLRASSASYVSDGSIGGIGGLGSVVAPPEIAKHGYIGQLYDLASLNVTAPSTNVNEAATRQLNACAVFDDATLLPLVGSAVSWSVASGPVSAIDASGLATADIVYQDTPVTVRGIYQGMTGLLGLQIINSNTDNYGLYAGDGIDDAWQVLYFGINNPFALAGVDYDHDGQTNGFEYVAGTIPTDADSKFRLRIESVPGQPDWQAVSFSPRYASRTYTALWRTNVASGSFAALSGTTTNDNLLERTITDRQGTNTARFYQIQITWP